MKTVATFTETVGENPGYLVIEKPNDSDRNVVCVKTGRRDGVLGTTSMISMSDSELLELATQILGNVAVAKVEPAAVTPKAVKK